MPLDWDDLFFEEQAERILDLFEFEEEEKDAIKTKWSGQVFEIDRPIYRGSERYIMDGRKEALSALQTICEEYVRDRSGVLDRRAERRQQRIENGYSNS